MYATSLQVQHQLIMLLLWEEPKYVQQISVDSDHNIYRTYTVE